MTPAGVEIVLYTGLGNLPHFNPDMDATNHRKLSKRYAVKSASVTACSLLYRNMPMAPGVLQERIGLAGQLR